MIQKKGKHSDKEKEEIYDYLVNLVKTLGNKEKYKYHISDDLDYFGIKNIENLFTNVGYNDYYRQYQSKVLLMVVANIMKAEEIKTKIYQ